MGEVSDVGTYTMAFTDALNPTFLVLLTIPVLRGCGWKLAGTSAAVGVPFSAASKTNSGLIARDLTTSGSSKPSSSMISMLTAMHLFENGTHIQFLAVTQIT